MNEYSQTIRLAEYNTLREELAEGKRYTFERPLVIVIAAGVAASQLADSSAIVLLPFPLIAVLVFN